MKCSMMGSTAFRRSSWNLIAVDSESLAMPRGAAGAPRERSGSARRGRGTVTSGTVATRQIHGKSRDALLVCTRPYSLGSDPDRLSTEE